MKLPHRRQFLHLAAGAAALPAVSQIAKAQSYPTRPVRIVVGFAPGGASDIYGRLIGQWLSERLGQQFIVENRAGAGGNLATEAVAKARPDGYTLLLTGANDAINPALYSNLNFNFVRDIAPVARISRGVGVLIVHPSFSANTLPEFISRAKANPGKIAVAHAGAGSAPHLYLLHFQVMAGVSVLPVPYRGSGPALTDLIGGQISVMLDNLSSSIEYIRSGGLRPLAVTDTARLAALPNIPTVDEFVPGYEATAFSGVAAPRNTPAEIIDKLNKEINVGLADARIKERIADMGGVPMPMTPADFGKFMIEYGDKWGKVIRAANIKPE
jgi:tripartite-type tricarboxylate transporter receptor subunit TctC